MKVYVSEMPESCEKCKFYKYEIEHNSEWGFETHRRMCKINGSLIQSICPLQSLADYTKQVRKEVCEEIRKSIRDIEFLGIEDYVQDNIKKSVIHEIDQIQGDRQ